MKAIGKISASNFRSLPLFICRVKITALHTLIIVLLHVFFVFSIPALNASEYNEYKSVVVVDSILSEFNRLSDCNSANAFFSILHHNGYIDEEYSFSSDTPTDTLRSQVWYWAAEYYYDCQLYETALRYSLQALPIYSAAGNDKEEADVLQQISIIYIRLSDYDNAIKYAKKCYDIDLRNGNADNISSSLNTIGSIYITAKMPQKAEKYILKAIEYSEKANNNYRLAVIYGVASEMYHAMGNNKLSLEYSTKAYQLEQKLGREEKAAIRLSQMSSAMISLGHIAEAKDNLLTIIPVFEKYNNEHSLAIVYKQMGRIEHIEGNDSLSIDFFNKSLEIFVAQHDLYNEASVHKGMYDILKNTNPFEALKHGDRYNELRDSIYQQDANSNLSAFEVGYENLELQQQNENLHIMMRYINILIGMIVFIFILIIIYVLRYVKKNPPADNVNTHSVPQFIQVLPEYISKEEEESQPIDYITDEEPDVQFQKRLEKAINTIKISDLSVETLAAELRMHPQTLRRRMLTINGKLPKAYISDIQMDKACELLINNRNMLIADVASQAGFVEASSFVRTFKKKYGVTPTQYREQYSH